MKNSNYVLALPFFYALLISCPPLARCADLDPLVAAGKKARELNIAVKVKSLDAHEQKETEKIKATLTGTGSASGYGVLYMGPVMAGKQADIRGTISISQRVSLSGDGVSGSVVLENKNFFVWGTTYRMPSGEWRGTIAGDDELSGVADISGATESSVPVSVQVHMAGDTLGQQAWISGDFTVSVEVEVEREAGKPATPPHDGAQPDPPAPKRLYCVLRIEQEAKCVYQCENSDYKVLDKLAGESCKKELYFESAP